MEDVSPEQTAYEAAEVQQFLKHPGLQRAFQATENRIIRNWKVAMDPLSREICWHKLKAFQDLKAELRAFGDRLPLHNAEE